MSDLVLWRGGVRHWQRGQAGHINIQHYAQIADGWIVHDGALRRVLDDRLVCLFRRRIRPFQPDGGVFLDWSPAVLERASVLQAGPTDGPGPVVGPVPREGGTETYRGTVEPHETDEFGLLLARGLWDKLTRALWAAQAAIGADRSTIIRIGLAGGAAVFDLTHHRQIPLGTPLVIRTSVLDVRENSLRMEHRVLDGRAEELLVRARYVLAFVDRASGERAAVPAEIRHESERLLADTRKQS